jgi:hypothetical protein
MLTPGAILVVSFIFRSKETKYEKKQIIHPDGRVRACAFDAGM